LDTQQGSAMTPDHHVVCMPDNELISESLKGNMAKFHDLHGTTFFKKNSVKMAENPNNI
jgi:hypothetical protein